MGIDKCGWIASDNCKSSEDCTGCDCYDCSADCPDCPYEEVDDDYSEGDAS